MVILDYYQQPPATTVFRDVGRVDLPPWVFLVDLHQVGLVDGPDYPLQHGFIVAEVSRSLIVGMRVRYRVGTVAGSGPWW